MLLRLSKNCFIRQYDSFSYIYNTLKNDDRIYSDAEVFLRFFSRVPVEKEDMLTNIFNIFIGVDKDELSRDFDDFIEPLIKDGLILAGENREMLNEQERYFDYSIPNPKTERDIVQPGYDDFELMPQIMLEKYFEKHPTLFEIQLDITQACTERCIHCYIPEYKPLFLTFDKIREVVDDFVLMGGLHISVSGGECMLHPDFIEIIRYIRDKDCTCWILSNLTLCNDEIIKLFQELDCSVQVSLYSMDPAIHDSITQLPGSWKQTKNAIEKLYHANVPVRISCPTMHKNFEGYLKVMEYAESMHMSAQTDFIMMAKADHDKTNLENRLNLSQTKRLLEDIILRDLPVLKEYFNPDVKNKMQSPEERAEQAICGAGTDKICLNANGEYYPCSGFQKYSLGNCYNDKLADVWRNSSHIKYLRSLRGKDIPICISCRNRNYCSMCLVRNFNETGDMLKVAEHFCNVADLNRQIVENLHNDIAQNNSK